LRSQESPSQQAHTEDFDLLWTGKIAPIHIGDVRELIHRGIVRPAPIKPEFLDDPASATRIERARKASSPLELLSALQGN